MKPFIKSPWNYIGNKYRQLPFLFSHFPEHCETFVDVFCGGMDVALNMLYHQKANSIVCNDINSYIMKAHVDFLRYSPEEIINTIQNIIDYYALTIDTGDFQRLREHYNRLNREFTNLDATPSI